MYEIPPRPPNYIPPANSEELVSRYAAGERFFHLAECKGSDLSGRNLSGAHLGNCDFREAKLDGANLSGSFLGSARFIGASLQRANLRETRTFNTYFIGADLRSADFRDAELLRTEFLDSCLIETNFRNALCVGTNFEGAWFGFTDLTGVDLSMSDLSSIQVKAPCVVSLDTLKTTSVGLSRKVQEVIDVEFDINPEEIRTLFKQCGVSASDLAMYDRWLTLPREFHSAFISYSHNDGVFARSLREALVAFRVPCWMDAWDLRPGETILDAINAAIKNNDRVLLLCSRSSLSSSWVEDEIAMTLEKERKIRENVLIPIDLDGYLFDGWESGVGARVRSRLAASFRGSRVAIDRLDEVTKLTSALKL